MYYFQTHPAEDTVEKSHTHSATSTCTCTNTNRSDPINQPMEAQHSRYPDLIGYNYHYLNPYSGGYFPVRM